MRHLRDVVRRTRSSLSRIFSSFNGRMQSIEKLVTDHRHRINQLESKNGHNIHHLEVVEHARRRDEDLRREALSDWERRLVLEKQYGNNKWSHRLIDEMMEYNM